MSKESALAAINVEHVKQVVEIILSRPDDHLQDVFLSTPDRDARYRGKIIKQENLCGTTACVAGWGALLTGYTFRFKKDFDGLWDILEFRAPGEKDWYQPSADPHPGTGRHKWGFDWELVAGDYFGFDSAIANDIFWDFERSRVLEKLQSMIDGSYEYPEPDRYDNGE